MGGSHFPQVGWLLLAAGPLLYAQWALHRYRLRQQRAYASERLLKHLLIPRSTPLAHAKTAGWLLIWTLLCLTLMNPLSMGSPAASGLKAPPGESASTPAQEVLFLVDTSPSMGSADGTDGKTRLEQAKDILEEAVQLMRGQNVSLYTFDSSLRLLVPSTLDYLFIRLSLHALTIDPRAKGTWLTPVFRELGTRILGEERQKRYQVVVITDGGDTQWESLTGEARKKAEYSLLNALPSSSPFHLFTVGVGGNQPIPIPRVSMEGRPVLSQLEPALLEALAAKTGGRYERASEWRSWELAETIVSQIEAGILPRTSSSAQKNATLDQEEPSIAWYYQIPLGAAIILYCLNLGLPDTQRSDLLRRDEPNGGEKRRISVSC